jgi:hypothetical protein
MLVGFAGLHQQIFLVLLIQGTVSIKKEPSALGVERYRILMAGKRLRSAERASCLSQESACGRNF